MDHIFLARIDIPPHIRCGDRIALFCNQREPILLHRALPPLYGVLLDGLRAGTLVPLGDSAGAGPAPETAAGTPGPLLPWTDLPRLVR
jgi:hypothetical protein